MKAWSISTTVRSPERIRSFLQILKQIEGQVFNEAMQVKYQPYFDDLESEIPFEVAQDIFNYQHYEDPPMRGRQSVNPLNKLGFAIAKENLGKVQITELGNQFLKGDFDISFVFFKSMLKLQFPNPMSSDFSEKYGFNVSPFVATLHLIDRINRKSMQKGISQTEFSLFVPTLINENLIDSYVDKIIEFRASNDKKTFIKEFVREFYKTQKLTDTQLNNLFDYGDNAIRYFRLTKYFRVTLDNFGGFANINFEPSRLTEIQQLLKTYNGQAQKFNNATEYLAYLADINKPSLPWENLQSLLQVAQNMCVLIETQATENNLQLTDKQKLIFFTDYQKFDRKNLEDHITALRNLHFEIGESLRKRELVGNLEKIERLVNLFADKKQINKIEPLQFEKLITDAYKILNDEIQIKPNYITDDNGEAISHATGNKADVECYYQNYKAILEVTLMGSKMQWVMEGQPIMRHLRDFENKHPKDEVYCVFVAPKIHNDTYSQYWIATKYEYDGIPQKIIPLTTEYKYFNLFLQSPHYKQVA